MINRQNLTDHRITCDLCHQHTIQKHITITGKYITDNPNSLRSDANKDGWSYDGTRDLCPHHTPTN
jgi:hypothetical protein